MKKIVSFITIGLLVFISSGEIAHAAFKYTLLESLPGFFQGGTEMTDLPTVILAIYKFGIWTIGISAMFMVTVGGIMYIGSAGNTSAAGKAKEIITDALIGVFAAMIAYLFLYVINPDLTKLNINFTAVNVEDMSVEDEQVNGSVSTSLTSISTATTTNTAGGTQLDSSFGIALDKLRKNGIKTIVTSGFRSVKKQQELIVAHCGGNPPTRKCVPPTCLLKNGPASCPHTTGRAADIWALDSNGRQAVGSMKSCLSNLQACFNNPYQKALIAAMRAEGFCVLASEPWHFEKPKMSSACS